MLDFGFSEILLTSVIALVVLGPERLPKVARQVGNWMGRARAMARQLSEQLDREVTAEEFLKQQNTRKVTPTEPAGATTPAIAQPTPMATTAPLPDAHVAATPDGLVPAAPAADLSSAPTQGAALADIGARNNQSAMHGSADTAGRAEVPHVTPPPPND
jgi:sec-independent protein translocase protein TatB